MKRFINLLIFICILSVNAYGYGTVVLFNGMFRASNLITQLPMQYVDIDGENRSQLICGHYLEIHLPAGFHSIDLYFNCDENNNWFGSYREAKYRGQAIHISSLDIKDGTTIYINGATGLKSDEKTFAKKTSGKHPMEQSPAVWLVPQTELAASTTVEKPKPQPSSDVDINIPVSAEKNESTFVVIIANEDYESVASVPFAHNDGLVFGKYAEKALGIPSRNIHFRENATLNHIRTELNWLHQVCEAFEGQASVIFYYAGHGIPDETSKSAYLLPVDGMGMDVATAYKLDDLYAALGSMSAKSVTVFMDACFSGAKREGGMLAQARGVAIKSKAGQIMGNTVVFTAAQGDETAYPIQEEGHGMFTYYLLKKLQETKGNVTLEDLGTYITTKVRQQSIIINGKSQTPTVSASAHLGDLWKTWKLR